MRLADVKLSLEVININEARGISHKSPDPPLSGGVLGMRTDICRSTRFQEYHAYKAVFHLDWQHCCYQSLVQPTQYVMNFSMQN